jgi:hypothetical protein
MGSLLPFAAETAKVRYGPGTFTMPLFARDFAKFTICALLPLVWRMAKVGYPPFTGFNSL